ncbi:hypothetical protein MLD38_024065 [Melastoma candidum]|uniref:Uncharacterized protein n=1 Tax=Melastoma candidum TaxID=119954 RepID=A0ACB9NR74_9MYRT|nr:hypothetical protein MLD38_024065 [Melastoma candidum]
MGDYNDALMRNQNSGVQARTKAQGRANVLQLKLIGQSHQTGLTANLLKLFEPRPPLEFKPPPEKRKCPPYSGIGQFVSHFAEPGDLEYAPPVQEAETPAQRRARIHQLRLEKGAEKSAEELKTYDPNNDPNISGDPYKTLFVAKLSYETTESRLKRELESYGPIKRVRLVHDTVSQKPRGYAFIEYLHTRDMKAAYKQADGKKIDGRRVLVDVERGRTVPNWRPRRLGGGLGTSRVGGDDASQRLPGRDQLQSGGPPHSEEPRNEDRHDREKSRERGREKEKEREKSRERSHDRVKERDHHDDRHHRDREKERDKESSRSRDRDRDRERGRDRGRDRDREEGDRDRGRERGRDRDRPREKDRERDRDRDREREDRGRSHDREYEQDRMELKHDRDRHAGRDREYDYGGTEGDHGWYGQPEPGQLDESRDYDHHRSHYDRGERGRYEEPMNHGRYDRYPDDGGKYDQMDEESYHYGRGTTSRD